MKWLLLAFLSLSVSGCTCATFEQAFAQTCVSRGVNDVSCHPSPADGEACDFDDFTGDAVCSQDYLVCCGGTVSNPFCMRPNDTECFHDSECCSGTCLATGKCGTSE